MFCYNPMSFAMFVESHVKNSILTAFKSIENRTCIKFNETQLAPASTAAAQKFAVVFSKHGNRYLLYKIM